MKGRLGFFDVSLPVATSTSEDFVRNNYVAYHSADVMGYEYSPRNGRFRFISRKHRSYLEKAIGCEVWVVTGMRDQKRTMIYRLAAVYAPDAVKVCRDEFHIVGRHGHVFKPPVPLNDLPWFQLLFREQNRFSFGFNRIRSDAVIGALSRLRQRNG
jgi:hypothetical protein